MGFEELASVDGTVLAADEASIPARDDGLLRGDGVFEVIRLYAGRPFGLGEHLDRIERSAAAIELPVDRARIEAEIEALLERHGDADAQLRIVLTRGGRRLLFTEELPNWAPTLTLASVTYSPSVILTGVKSISYAANMQATRLAQGRGADEALLVRPDRVVLEAPTSSIFWVAGDDELRTPSLETGILDSITRRVLVAEVELNEGEFSLDDVLEASEAFLASTTREIHPVSRIDDRELEAPGPRTREAQATFSTALAETLRTGAGT